MIFTEQIKLLKILFRGTGTMSTHADFGFALCSAERASLPAISSAINVKDHYPFPAEISTKYFVKIVH